MICRTAAGVNSVLVISWDIECPDINNRISTWHDVGMSASEVRHSLCCFLDDTDFFVRQAVEFVDQSIDLLVGSVDLALDKLLVVWGSGIIEISVQP